MNNIKHETLGKVHTQPCLIKETDEENFKRGEKYLHNKSN